MDLNPRVEAIHMQGYMLIGLLCLYLVQDSIDFFSQTD
jgi:hypothetical protein